MGTTPMPPTVDVVILSWNRQEDTLEAIDSVLAQEIDSLALWVVDQGSQAEQLAALRQGAEEHSEINLIELPRNLGVPAGRNIGIRSGSSDFVVCLDNDAVFESPHALQLAVDRLAADDRLGALAFRALDYYTRALDLGAWAYPRVHRETTTPVPVARFVGVGHALRRSAFIESGGYDDALFFCEEELDLSYRMIDRGYRILYEPSIAVLHKASPEERIGWDDGRVYHQVRNAVLVHHRHHRRLWVTVPLACGWLLRAFYNGKGRQALRGVRDAVRLAREDPQGHATLGAEARRYIWEHDTRLRGPWLRRLRDDVFSGFPNLEAKEARSS